VKALLKAIDEYSNVQIKHLMKMALYTGMRRGELFKLKWDHVTSIVVSSILLIRRAVSIRRYL
jgi:integrase